MTTVIIVIVVLIVVILVGYVLPNPTFPAHYRRQESTQSQWTQMYPEHMVVVERILTRFWISFFPWEKEYNIYMLLPQDAPLKLYHEMYHGNMAADGIEFLEFFSDIEREFKLPAITWSEAHPQFTLGELVDYIILKGTFKNIL